MAVIPPFLLSTLTGENRLCSNEYGFQPPPPIPSRPLHPHVLVPILAIAHNHRGGEAHSRGKYQARAAFVLDTRSEFALVTIQLWQKWSRPINTTNPDMMDWLRTAAGREGRNVIGLLAILEGG